MRNHISIIEAAQQHQDLHMQPLEFDTDALWPSMSEHCVKVHYHKLTKRYFEKYEQTGDLFQKAGALLHNDHWWPLLQSYDEKNKPSPALVDHINTVHGSLRNFKKSVQEAAMGIQGNGWVLIMEDLSLQPIANHLWVPHIAMAVDVWEHATVDWDFDRAAYLENLWHVINWSQLESQLS
jgi:superoxide dismutase